MSFPPTLSAGVPYEVLSVTRGSVSAILRTSSKLAAAALAVLATLRLGGFDADLRTAELIG